MQMEQLIEQQRNNGSAEKAQLAEWKDPLQMLAKQCDTISGDEGKAAASREAQQRSKDRRQQQQMNGSAAEQGTPKSSQQPQQTRTNGKAKSPSKQQELCAFPSAVPPHPFLNGFCPPPAHLAALMGAGFFPPGGLLPPQPHSSANGHPQRPPQQPQQHPFGVPPPPMPGFPAAPFPLMPGAQFPPQQQQQMGQMVQQLMAAMHPQMPPPGMLPPMFPLPNVSGAGIPLPPSMPHPMQAAKRPEQNGTAHTQLDEAAAALAMAMFPAGAFPPNGALPPPAEPPSAGPSANGNGTGAPLSIQALLMAAACGQLPQGCLACTYRLKEGGQLCGKVFPSDEQLFAHYKSAHIAQHSSPSAVSSTTAGETGDRAAAKNQQQHNGGSPSSSRSTPVQQNGGTPAASATKPHSNPGAMFNGWPAPPALFPPAGMPAMPPPPHGFMAAGGKDVTPHGVHSNSRFHPYAQPNAAGQKQQQQQLMAAQPSLQQMAMAISNLGMLTGLGMGVPPAGGPVPAQPFDFSAGGLLGGRQHQHQSSQLAALAAMANSVGTAPAPAGGPLPPPPPQTSSEGDAMPAPVGAVSG